MVGKTVLQYQLVDKLGSGGMGEVYKAQDTRLNRFAAIKVLPAKMSTDPERRRRFIQEAQAASALNHPNIITIYDIVSEGDAQYMVMEYVAGQTLHDSIPAGGLPVPQVLQYGTQMADALSTAHAAGIVHRDLKPSNVMITRTGLVKILDFGLAKLTDLSPTSQFDNQATALGPLTQEGAILGTVSYMSPEQAEGKPVDARSDIFSFGSVLYEMVTGRRAFDGGSSISTLSAVLRDDVKPMADVAPGTPAPLEAVISRCLPKDPNARWQSMRDVEQALAGLKRTIDSGVFYPPTTIPGTTGASRAAESQLATVTRPVEPRPSAPAGAPAVPVAAAPNVPIPPTAPQAVIHPSRGPGLMLGLLVVVIVAAVAAGAWWWNSTHQAAPQSATQAPASQAPEIPALPPVAPEPGSKVPPPSNTAAQPAAPPSQPGTKAEVPLAETSKPSPRGPAVELLPVTVSDALPFRIILGADVPSDAPEGQALRFTVVDGLQVNNNVVVAKGAAVTGAVTGETGKKRILGMGGGKLTFRLLQADAVDGTKVSVRAMSGRRAEGPTLRTFETIKSSKTKGLAAAQGTEYIAYIDGEQTVSVRK